MPRRNDIAKILIIAVSSCALLSLVAGACPPPIFPTYKVGDNFRVVLKSQSQPMAGVKVNFYREEGGSNGTRHLLFTPSSEVNGSLAIPNLEPGSYFVETTGYGAGSAAHFVVQASKSSETRNEIELQWPARIPLKTQALKGRIFSSDAKSGFTKVELKLWTKDRPSPVEAVNAGSAGQFAFNAIQPGLYFLDVTINYHNALENKVALAEGWFPVTLVRGESGSLERLELGLTDTSCGLLVTQIQNSMKLEQDAAQK